MFVLDLKHEFYEVIGTEKILILAALDVDSVCTTKMMLQLFGIDNISYALVTVANVEEMRRTFHDYATQTKVVLLINCGGAVDLMELFDNPPETIFFVLDNHRPFHIFNVYNESSQVRILSPTKPDEGVPLPTDIFREEPEDTDSDDSAEEVDLTDEDVEARLEVHQKRQKRRQDYTAWKSKRHRILFEYTQRSFYGAPSSLVILELCWSLNREQNDLIWWAIVGLTDFLTMNRIDRSNYTLLVSELQGHVARINRSNTIPLECLKISFEHEPYLYLYRQWNVYDSMKVTPNFAVKFKSWKVKGVQRFHQYLAEIGLPLAQARQNYVGMDLDLKRGLKDVLNRRANKYKLEDICIGSFIGTCLYQYKYSGLDIHLSLLALLEAPNDKTNADRFMLALKCLSKERLEVISSGISDAKILLGAIYTQVKQVLELKQINCTHQLLYYVMQEGGPDSRFFIKPNCLLLLAQFVMKAFNAHRTGYQHRHMPFLIISPPHDGNCLVIGLPPMTADTNSNIFGKVFERVNDRLTPCLQLDCFDAHMAYVETVHKQRFIETILSILS